MELLTRADVDRILAITDSLDLHRNWVIVPVAAHPRGVELRQPDGKILIQAPGGEAFEPWIRDLRNRLERLDLSPTPKAHQHDPQPPRIVPQTRPDYCNRYLRNGGTW
ncbi:MAG: hypothetical protein HY716_08290 [Planctomycetes bacterium]|nr:hypothetical protein [Planctomycetota bacterium]